jgi:peptide/nickel transport system ATP-binding protein
MAGEAFVFCDNLVKIYKVADLEVVALQGLDLAVENGEMMALVGASGSGKSTLLNVIGGLDTPSAGKVLVGGNDLLRMGDRDRVCYKRETVGFVWQQPGRNLLPYLTAVENIELPMTLTDMTAAQRRARSLELLEILGLTERANFHPDRLSGGEQQRTALGVALANSPPLLLADEPTGQLDSDGASQVFDALRHLNEALGTTVVVVTHDPQVVARVDRVIGIRDGRTSTEIRRERNHHDGTFTEEEWVILDQTGRLQIPQVYVDTLLMRGRVKVRLETDHVSVWPSVVPRRGGSLANREVVDGSEGDKIGQWRPDQQFDLGDPVGDSVERRRLETDRRAGAQTCTRQAATRRLSGERANGDDYAVETRALSRTFRLGVEEIRAIRGVTLSVPRGVFALVKGRSGSGKTTLLNLIGGLDDPTSGTVSVNGRDLGQMSADERVLLRREHVSFVFQTFGLMSFLSAQENVEAPLRLLRRPSKEREERASRALDLVGLSDRAHHRTHELSGGQLQRVALARALVGNPSLILADEPTGQLDTVSGSNIIALLRQVAHQLGITVIVASHDPKAEEAADCVYELCDGRLISADDFLQPHGSGAIRQR